MFEIVSEPGRTRTKRLLFVGLLLPVCFFIGALEVFLAFEAGLAPPTFLLPLLAVMTAINAVVVWKFISQRTTINIWWIVVGLFSYTLVGYVVYSLYSVSLLKGPSSTISAPTTNGGHSPNIDVSPLRIPNSGFDFDFKRVIEPLQIKPKPAYWNAWFTKDGKAVPDVLVVNNEYTFYLDLSAFNYATLRKDKSSQSVPADTPLQVFFDNTDAKNITLTIKPVIPEDAGLSIIETPLAAYSMAVDLDQIRAPKKDAIEQYIKDETIPLGTLSDQVKAGKISFKIRARVAGCAAISLSIFNDFRPLDHLVHRVTIIDAQGNAPVCSTDSAESGSQFTGGLDALRDAALGVDAAGGPLIGDAAFHIFDTAENTSTVVFVDGRRGPRLSFYGWQTDSSIVDYLRTTGFETLILQARKDAANKQPGSYVNAANELWNVLFGAKASSGTRPDAEKAASAFKEIVEKSASSPVIVVRIASTLGNGQTRSLFAPFGILGAKGDGAVLTKPIVVVQPMARERFVPQDRCIMDWTLAIPEKLANVEDDVMDIDHFPDPLPGVRIKDMAGLKPFLANSKMKNFSSPSGLLVLAHQNQGYLWFEAETNRIIKQQISREFAPGSVGIFSACSAASTTTRNAELLQKLNEQGLDTLIASPFTLEAEYGVKFSYSFIEVIKEAKSNHERPTIFELFTRAVSKTAAKFAKMSNGNYEELGLEYVLLGNPAISLCGERQSGK